MHIGVVLNPQARKNRAVSAERARRLAQALGDRGTVVVTRDIEALRAAVPELLTRATHLISDGGDGALNCLLHEVRAAEPAPERWPVFVPSNGGTIDFVAKKVGIRGRSDAIVARLLSGAEATTVELDTLHLEGNGGFDRLGFALAAGGVGNRFFDKYYEEPEPTQATIVGVIARTIADMALSAITGRPAPYAAHMFEPTLARVSIDGETLAATKHACIHAGSFDVNLGGVLRVFPLARERGVLHLQAGFLSPLAMVRNLPALAAGGAIVAPGMRDTSGAEMVVEALGPPLSPILDGERFGDLTHLVVRAGPRVRLAHVVAGRHAPPP